MLERTERLVQAAITHPGGAGYEETVARAAPLVRERGGLSAVDRLEIYAGMFPLRMREAIASDYPALELLLGPAAFERLVRDYVTAHPSRSFTLARLGDHLPVFVAGWAPARTRTLLTDVARLEGAAARVFEAACPPRPVLPPLVSGADGAWEEARFAAAPDAALLRVCPGAVAALDACLEGSIPSRRVGRGSRWVLYHRKEFVVLRRNLAPKAGRILERLFAGRPLGEALGSVGRAVPAEISDWFDEWARLGVLIPDPASNRSVGPPYTHRHGG